MNSALDYLRFPTALALALLFTGGVFWSLHHLIDVRVDVHKELHATRIEFTRMLRMTQTETKEQKKVQRQRPPTVPQVPQMSLTSSNFQNTVQMLNPNIDTHGAMSGVKMSVAGSDRDVIPLVRINPEYPQRALNMGVEGWVIVQFDITAAGTVKNAKVIDSDPKGYFEKAAVKAVERWRYNPKVEEGVAVERRGVQTLIKFQLSKK